MNQDYADKLEIKRLEFALRSTRDRLERTKKANSEALIWLRTGYHNKAVAQLEKGQRV